MGDVEISPLCGAVNNLSSEMENVIKSIKKSLHNYKDYNSYKDLCKTIKDDIKNIKDASDLEQTKNALREAKVKLEEISSRTYDLYYDAMFDFNSVGDTWREVYGGEKSGLFIEPKDKDDKSKDRIDVFCPKVQNIDCLSCFLPKAERETMIKKKDASGEDDKGTVSARVVRKLCKIMILFFTKYTSTSLLKGKIDKFIKFTSLPIVKDSAIYADDGKLVKALVKLVKTIDVEDLAELRGYTQVMNGFSRYSIEWINGLGRDHYLRECSEEIKEIEQMVEEALLKW